jgi:hypothetical protein
MDLRPASALRVWRVGDLGLITSKWPIIGELGSWDRSVWPVPIFIQRGALFPHTNWRVYFSDNDPAKRIKMEREPNERPDLPEDSLFGAGAAEIELSKVLD